MPLKSTIFIIATITALFAGMAAAAVKNVAVVETDVDARSGAVELNRAEISLITTEIRREAVENLPRGAYNIMTTETVYAQGSATLVECAEENCVIALGSKIGADYIVRGTVSKIGSKFTLSVEMYETEDGNLVALSKLARSEDIGELMEKTGAACAEMFKKFAGTQNPAAMPVPAVTATTPTATAATTAPTSAPAAYTLTVNANPDSGGAKYAGVSSRAQTAGSGGSVSRYPARGYFPPKDAGKGEVEVGSEYSGYTRVLRSEDEIYDSYYIDYVDLSLSARYSIIQGLEVAITLPLPITSSFTFSNSNGAADTIRSWEYAGFGSPVIGVRYWLPKGPGFLLDVTLPIDSRDGMDSVVTARLGTGIQYAVNFAENLSFGSQISYLFPSTTNKAGWAHGNELNIGMESDYSLGMVTPYLGVNVLMRLTDDFQLGINPFAGTVFEFNRMWGADAFIEFGLGERYVDNTFIAMGASLFINF